ncbi:hypothetical protein Tco_0481818 [Tanacetum coccineum]
MVNVIPPDHDHDVPVVEPNQHDDVPVVPEPVLEDEDEDPEEDEFKEEEDPQEDEDDMEIDIEEDENEPELTYHTESACIGREERRGKDIIYGKLILDLGNEVRSSVEQGTAAMEKLVEKLKNVEEKAKCKKLKKELKEARLSNTFLRMPEWNELERRSLSD